MAKLNSEKRTIDKVRKTARKNLGGIKVKNGIAIIPVKLNIKKLFGVILTLVIYSLLFIAYFSKSTYQTEFSEYAIYLSLARDILNIILASK